MTASRSHYQGLVGLGGPRARWHPRATAVRAIPVDVVRGQRTPQLHDGHWPCGAPRCSNLNQISAEGCWCGAKRACGMRRARYSSAGQRCVVRIFQRLWREEADASLIDYSILVALITVLVVVGGRGGGFLGPEHVDALATLSGLALRFTWAMLATWALPSLGLRPNIRSLRRQFRAIRAVAISHR